MLGFAIGSFWYPGLAIFTLFQMYFLPIRKNTVLAKVIQLMAPSIIGLTLLMMGISFLLALTINNEIMNGQFPLLDLKLRYDILFVLPWMRSWDKALEGKLSSYLSIWLLQILICCMISFGVYHYFSQ